MNVLIINFSGRENGNCENIANVIQNEYNKENVYANIINFNHQFIFPCSNCNYECFKDRNECPYASDDIKPIYNEIMNSDFIYYIIPCYCGYPCANFFIFNERSCSFFDRQSREQYINKNKKFIVVSNSNQDSFRKLLSFHTNKNPNTLFLESRKYDVRSTNGNLMNNENAKNEVLEFMKVMVE